MLWLRYSMHPERNKMSRCPFVSPRGGHEYEVLATSFSWPQHTRGGCPFPRPLIFSLTVYLQNTHYWARGEGGTEFSKQISALVVVYVKPLTTWLADLHTYH